MFEILPQQIGNTEGKGCVCCGASTVGAGAPTSAVFAFAVRESAVRVQHVDLVVFLGGFVVRHVRIRRGGIVEEVAGTVGNNGCDHCREQRASRNWRPVARLP